MGQAEAVNCCEIQGYLLSMYMRILRAADDGNLRFKFRVLRLNRSQSERALGRGPSLVHLNCALTFSHLGLAVSFTPLRIGNSQALLSASSAIDLHLAGMLLALSATPLRIRPLPAFWSLGLLIPIY